MTDERSLARAEQRALAARERGRTLVFAILFVVFVSAPMLLLPLWVGWTLAPVFGGLLWLLYRATTSQAAVTRPARTAGAVVCPKCGSQQTDEVDALDDAGELVHDWRCFQCDHQWR
ncbi:MAG: hypothetical protein H6713_10200 [Myxococcales bacterium]|nr:hypothetical protein [Myxococcales bacterium]MCB9750358.1 hypothetical protein [Myxococcales bacterium]